MSIYTISTTGNRGASMEFSSNDLLAELRIGERRFPVSMNEVSKTDVLNIVENIGSLDQKSLNELIGRVQASRTIFSAKDLPKALADQGKERNFTTIRTSSRGRTVFLEIARNDPNNIPAHLYMNGSRFNVPMSNVNKRGAVTIVEEVENLDSKNFETLVSSLHRKVEISSSKDRR